MRNLTEGRRPDSRREARRLARINTKITRLTSELETLQFVQDRLERELESAAPPALRSKFKKRPSGEK